MNTVIVGLLLLLAPITPESSKFNIYQNGRKVGSEEFTISARLGGYVVDGHTELVGDPAPLRSHMELDDQLNPTSYEYQHGNGTIRLKVGKPTSELATVDGAQESSTDFRLPEGAAIVDNNFFHHVVLLLYRVGATGKTLPVFVPQDMQVGQVTVKSTGSRSYELQVGDTRFQATTDAGGKLIRLEVPEAKVLVER